MKGHNIFFHTLVGCFGFNGPLRQYFSLQSTLVISKSKGPSETVRDIRTSTYQMCRIEDDTNRKTKLHK